jgi:protein TonB
MKENDWYGLLGSLTLHAILLVLFMFMKSDPLISEQIGFIQVDFGTFSEGRPVQQAPVTAPEQEQPTPEPEPEVEDPPAPADPEVSKPVDLPDVEPIQADEPPIQSPDTEVEAIQPEDPEDEEEVEEEEEETPEIRPLGSGNTEGEAGAEQGTDGEARVGVQSR